MKLRDRQTVFDAVLETYGSLEAMINIVMTNDNIFANELNGFDGIPINKTTANYLKEKQVITY